MEQTAPPDGRTARHPARAARRPGPTLPLARERDLLAYLASHPGRVISREEFSAECGLDDLSARRCDSLIVAIRRLLPEHAIVTVRKRGWMLAPDAADAAISLLRGLSRSAAGDQLPPTSE